MDINKILDNEQLIKSNMDLLAGIYLEKTGRKVCRTCPSDINYMIISLKNIFKMTQFKFKKANAMYKNRRGDKVTISNATMTDEKAIEFLKTNKERIRLFAEYPKDWKELISEPAETEEEKEKKIAIQAEIKALKDAKKEAKKLAKAKAAKEKLAKEDLKK